MHVNFRGASIFNINVRGGLRSLTTKKLHIFGGVNGIFGEPILPSPNFHQCTSHLTVMSPGQFKTILKIEKIALK